MPFTLQHIPDESKFAQQLSFRLLERYYPRAFAFGLRLMAIDSTLDEVPDTPANALHFGRLTSGKSQSPFPQVRCLYLAEAGTHAIIDAVLARCKASEQALAWVILRSIQLG